jgi:hypothetical protein
VCNQETPKREAKGPSWTINACQYAEPEMLKWIRSARLRLAGHIVRRRESDPDTKSTFDLLLGERTVGRPKSRRIEEVEREIKGTGVKGWTRINGRKCWRRPRPKLDCRAKERGGG